MAAVREHADLEFVNGGGTGSLAATSADPAVTEVTAGSGLYGPTLFDATGPGGPRPAAFFACPVVRRPAPGIATVLGGGWIASGPAEPSRLPMPWLPAGLKLLGTEGAGEVQTPLVGAVADALRIGDRVWFRHAKAGELCEHVNELHLVDGDADRPARRRPTGARARRFSDAAGRRGGAGSACVRQDPDLAVQVLPDQRLRLGQHPVVAGRARGGRRA